MIQINTLINCKILKCHIDITSKAEIIANNKQALMKERNTDNVSL